MEGAACIPPTGSPAPCAVLALGAPSGVEDGAGTEAALWRAHTIDRKEAGTEWHQMTWGFRTYPLANGAGEGSLVLTFVSDRVRGTWESLACLSQGLPELC